jgi:hypothetical protein
VLLHAISDGVNLLTWSQDSFGFADSFDEAAGRYKGLRGGTMVNLADPHSPDLVVKPDVASKQMEAERVHLSRRPPKSDRVDGREATPTGWTATARRQPGPSSQNASTARPFSMRPASGETPAESPMKSFPTWPAWSGATVTVTIEMEAEIPDGAPDHVVRTVTENSRTLKFTSQGFEKE